MSPLSISLHTYSSKRFIYVYNISVCLSRVVQYDTIYLFIALLIIQQDESNETLLMKLINTDNIIVICE